jgi:hypothetical protein
MSENWDSQYAQVARLQHAELERLHAELDQLRAENQRLLAWIMGDGPDALTALQRVYSDPKTTEPNVVRAASAALPFERSKPPTMNVNAGILDFKEYVRSIRLRQAAKDKAKWALEAEAKVIEHEPKTPWPPPKQPPLDLEAEPAPTILGEGPEPAA